jgi:hypothetical protein
MQSLHDERQVRMRIKESRYQRKQKVNTISKDRLHQFMDNGRRKQHDWDLTQR